jgi:hypothetical protein
MSNSAEFSSNRTKFRAHIPFPTFVFESGLAEAACVVRSYSNENIQLALLQGIDLEVDHESMAFR